MEEHQAKLIAQVFGGFPWQPYPGIWLLTIKHNNGSVVVIDNEVICSYDDERALEDGDPVCEIRLDASDNT